jgi:DNA primase
MNFEKLFRDYNIKYSLKINRNWVNCNCPFCDTKETSFNLGFNPAGNYYHCWKSKHSYSLQEVLSILLNIPIASVNEVLKDYAGVGEVIPEKKKSNIKHLELPTDSFTPAERKYLKSRGFSPKYLNKKYNIVGGGISGDWKFRIIIPVYFNGKLMSWTGRSILSKEKLKQLEIPRYKNLAIEKSVKNIKELFFNIDNCKSDTVVLTEGAFDVLRFDGNAICSMGTELTESQINLLASRFRKIFILFDNEPEAQKKARKFGIQLSAIGLDIEIVNAYEDFGKNDMGECTSEEVETIKKELKL